MFVLTWLQLRLIILNGILFKFIFWNTQKPIVECMCRRDFKHNSWFYKGKTYKYCQKSENENTADINTCSLFHFRTSVVIIYSEVKDYIFRVQRIQSSC